MDVSKKKVIRSWVTRRVREAVREELKVRGWGRDGGVLTKTEGEKTVGGGKVGLKGALKIFMAPERRQDVITASGEEVRQGVRGIIGEVVRLQARGNWVEKGRVERPESRKQAKGVPPAGPGFKGRRREREAGG